MMKAHQKAKTSPKPPLSREIFSKKVAGSDALTKVRSHDIVSAAPRLSVTTRSRSEGSLFPNTWDMYRSITLASSTAYTSASLENERKRDLGQVHSQPTLEKFLKQATFEGEETLSNMKTASLKALLGILITAGGEENQN